MRTYLIPHPVSPIIRHGINWPTNQYIHPVANPTAESTYLEANSTIGALTGISAVISPSDAIVDHATVPVSRYVRIAPPGPAAWRTLALVTRIPG